MNFANHLRANLWHILDNLPQPNKTGIRTSSNYEYGSLPAAPPFAPHLPFARLNFLRLSLCLVVLVIFRFGYKYFEQDYKMFLALGPGGTPYSFRGYTQLSFISLFKLRDPYIAPELPSRLRPHHGFLRDLQPRQGRRPLVVGVAPQRQVTQNCPPAMVHALQDSIRELADECPSHWYVATSAFEKHNEALFSRFKTFTEPDYYGEIVHSHARDGSMHLTLHPEDVKLVLKKGWGERHPLAHGRTWWWHWPVPRGFMIIYGPRDRAELQQVKSIIRAAAWWVSGMDPRKADSVLQGAPIWQIKPSAG
jgi:Family of unknown function (DUF5519)